MPKPNRVFEDAARVAGGAIGTFSGVKREIENLVKYQIDRLLTGMDLVTREEFDAVKQMAAKARDENERLEERLVALEGAKPKPANRKTKPAKKSSAKRAAKK
ncbi:MAG: hypothetical protein CFH41_00111 [Alphaproteobacteria bacterium MarineAlpha11_Bin1]|nr:MAG: hypothetical protein CFH41_00111 [Alphaproteobacteria bacterium MarineAlpha11_Bin1]|tara:strand:+ start:5089 stop:5397 length:309 start_codon:yes stop_codon:yes gene_type:complete